MLGCGLDQAFCRGRLRMSLGGSWGAFADFDLFHGVLSAASTPNDLLCELDPFDNCDDTATKADLVIFHGRAPTRSVDSKCLIESSKRAPTREKDLHDSVGILLVKDKATICTASSGSCSYVEERCQAGSKSRKFWSFSEITTGWIGH